VGRTRTKLPQSGADFAFSAKGVTRVTVGFNDLLYVLICLLLWAAFFIFHITINRISTLKVLVISGFEVGFILEEHLL